MAQAELRAVNFEEVRRALREAPDLAFKWVKGDLKRSATKFRNQFIRKRLKGRPGIKWKGGKQSVGGNVKSFATGRTLSELRWVAKISRLLRVHEEGATIPAQRDDGWLYLSRKTGKKGGGTIIARIRSVTIPARLGFMKEWDAFTPEAIERVHGTLARAVRVALERRMNVVRSVTQRISAA